MQAKESSVIYNQSPEEIFDRTIILGGNILASFRATLTVILYMQIFGNCQPDLLIHRIKA